MKFGGLFELGCGSGLGLGPIPSNNSLAVLVLVIYPPVIRCGVIQTSFKVLWLRWKVAMLHRRDVSKVDMRLQLQAIIVE